VRFSLLTSLMKFVLQFETSKTAKCSVVTFCSSKESKFQQLILRNVTAKRETLVPNLSSLVLILPKYSHTKRIVYDVLKCAS
jgi:hypothetical protein